MGWLGGYEYRKELNMVGSPGAGNGYCFYFKIGESSGSPGVDFHTNNRCYDFPNDLRFTRGDTISECDYYIVHVTGGSPNKVARIWVKTNDNMDFSNSIFMYYRKLGDADNSNRWTLPLLDTFEHYTLGEPGWPECEAYGWNRAIDPNYTWCNVDLTGDSEWPLTQRMNLRRDPSGQQQCSSFYYTLPAFPNNFKLAILGRPTGNVKSTTGIAFGQCQENEFYPCGISTEVINPYPARNYLVWRDASNVIQRHQENLGYDSWVEFIYKADYGDGFPGLVIKKDNIVIVDQHGPGAVTSTLGTEFTSTIKTGSNDSVKLIYVELKPYIDPEPYLGSVGAEEEAPPDVTYYVETVRKSLVEGRMKLKVGVYNDDGS